MNRLSVLYRAGLGKCLLATLAVLALAAEALAGEWPQILGPSRDGVAERETLAERWPKDGPKVVWERKAGSGFAGVAVADGKAILFHRVRDEQIVEALDAATGKPLWRTAFPTKYVPTYTSDDGPRCVPLIHKGHVYCHGVDGDLFCLALADGKQRWFRPLAREFDTPAGPPNFFGAGASPLIEGDKLLLNVGGAKKGSGIVAFALADGKTVWQATDEQASYSSPVAATIDGTRHALFVTRANVVSLNPDDGGVRFRFPFGKRGPTVNAANPLVVDGHLFVSASYQVGAVFASIGKREAKPLWESDDVLSSQYPTAIYKEGQLYGIHGRQDSGVAELRCVEAKTGKVAWRQRDFGMATLILADDKLVILKTDGTLCLAEATPRAYRQLTTAQVSSKTTQPLPALASGRLYVRDVDSIKCLDLRHK